MSDYAGPTPFQVGTSGCCPKCGQGRLFVGILSPASKCRACGLDYGFIDAGDGPAVFVILIIGFVVTAMAMGLQSAWGPPIWVHLLVWSPVTLVLCLLGLRFAKGIMISLQYKTAARQGELGE